ncbi:MAG: winged helix-turn-helix transcriptional regulator [Deltaproteobacteria bacterium]|nr:winged helix-turn-helix transcriptional regulator [Deltaproteobacteria bacterium]
MRKEKLNPAALEDVARIFKAMCESVRLHILQELQEGEKSVSQLIELIPTSQPNLSKHLKILTEANLLDRRQEGNSVYYSIADSMVYEICDTVCRGIEDRLSRQLAAYNLKTVPMKNSRQRRGSSL